MKLRNFQASLDIVERRILFFFFGKIIFLDFLDISQPIKARIFFEIFRMNSILGDPMEGTPRSYHKFQLLNN